MKFLTTSDQLKLANSSVTQDLDIASLGSFIEKVEFDLSIQIGDATLNAIAKNEQGINMLRRIIADLSLSEYASSGAVQLDNAGIFVVRSNNKAPASDKKLMNFKSDCLQRGWANFELLIAYLEANPATFITWPISVNRAAYFSTLFGNSNEFAAFGGIGVSASLFKILKPLIRRVEDDVLVVNFGSEIVEELRAKRLDGSIANPLLKLARKFMRIVAPLAMAEAIPMQLVSITDVGIFQPSIVAMGNTSDNIQSLSSVSMDRLAMVLGKLEAEGNAMVAQVLKWISVNNADYPQYSVPTAIVREDVNRGDNNIYLL